MVDCFIHTIVFSFCGTMELVKFAISVLQSCMKSTSSTQTKNSLKLNPLRLIEMQMQHLYVSTIMFVCIYFTNDSRSFGLLHFAFVHFGWFFICLLCCLIIHSSLHLVSCAILFFMQRQTQLN